jgi:hypothetical protein
LLELLTAVAALVILLGFAISLARLVRRESAESITRFVLVQLDAAVMQYQARSIGAVGLPGEAVPTVLPSESQAPGIDRERLERLARANSQALVRWLRQQNLALNDEVFGELPVALYDDVTLRDAWGSPIVYMPGPHELIGMASRDRPWFFFSAGPDRDYLTRGDNLYSYESR